MTDRDQEKNIVLNEIIKQNGQKKLVQGYKLDPDNYEKLKYVFEEILHQKIETSVQGKIIITCDFEKSQDEKIQRKSFFKTLWEKLRNFFNPEQRAEELKPQQVIKEVESVPKIKANAQQIELFHSLRPGDVVFARMPLPEKQMENIKEGHKERPYYVAKVCDDSIMAFPCTSNREREDHKTFLIPKGYYKNNVKDTYIQLIALHQLTPDCLRFFMFSVNTTDFTDIQKKALILRPKYYEVFDNISECYRAGDILEYRGNLNYVFERKGDTLICFRIQEIKSGENFDQQWIVNTEKSRYLFHTDQKMEWKATKGHITICDRCSSALIDYIDKTVRFTPPVIVHKEPKEKLPKGFENCFSRYSPGTLFVNNFSNDEIVYLFSTERADYGMYSADYLDTDEYDVAPIRKLELDLCTLDGVLEQEDLEEVLDYHIEMKHLNFEYLKKIRSSINEICPVV